METPEVNFRVGNEKGNMHPKGGTQRCCKPPDLDNLTKMVTLYSLLINNINDRLRTFTEQCLIVLWVFFSPFLLAGLAVSVLDVVCLFSKAQNRGQSIGDALSDSSENQNVETL